MKKIILFLVIFLLPIFSLFSDPTDDIPATYEESIKKILELKKTQKLILDSLEETVNEYEKLKEEYNQLIADDKLNIERANKYKEQIEALIIRLEDTEKVLDKIKDEKKLKLISDIVRIGFLFEADCKSTEEKFLFDTWFAGVNVLLYDRVFVQTSVGYVKDFNIKFGVGFYLW